MKTCKHCSLNYEDNKKFCKKCGSPLEDKILVETRETAKKLVFEERLKVDPLNLDILREFALFLSDIGLFREAVSITMRILAIDEDDQMAKRLLADAYLRLNMYEQAIESARQLLAENPDDTGLLKILIDATHASDQHDAAILNCDKLLALEPNNYEVLHTKALSMLLSDRVAEASGIFAKLQKEGFKDRHTLIYAGISCSLNNEFETAIEILEPVLSDNELSYYDVDNNRGFLFLAYSYCQFENMESKVHKWLSIVDFQIIKNNHLALDEQAYVKLISSFFDQISASGKPGLGRNNLEKWIEKYITSKSNYLSAQTKELQAELWYKISLKQADMELLDEAKQSLNKSIDLMPFEAEYSETLKEVTQTHKDKKKKRKRRSIIFWSVLIALLLIIFGFTHINKRQKENETWKKATSENTSISYQRYLKKYPEGRYASEAVIAQEEAMWQEVMNENELGGYFKYLAKYPNGKFSTYAKSQVSEVEPIRLQGQIQILNPRPKPYVFYLEKIGDETPWFRNPDIGKFLNSFSSNDYGYEIIYNNGDIIHGGPNVSLPVRKNPVMKIRAVKPNQVIEIKVTEVK